MTSSARHAAAILLPLFAVAACRPPGPATGQPATFDRRAVLLNPDDPFWSTRAPDTVRARFETSKGPFVIEMYRAWGPLGVDRAYNLIRAGFFDDSRFYRSLPNYIVQFGIPGDPEISRPWRNRAFPDDTIHQSNVRGTFGFAMTGPDTRTTQIYINRVDNLRNDGMGFTLLGRVIEGMSIVDSLYSGYGDAAVGGMRAGRQQRAFEEGNAHMDRDFPLFDRLIRATIVGLPGSTPTSARAPVELRVVSIRKIGWSISQDTIDRAVRVGGLIVAVVVLIVFVHYKRR